MFTISNASWKFVSAKMKSFYVMSKKRRIKLTKFVNVKISYKK